MIQERQTCRTCGNATLELVLDLGKTPLANDFIDPAEPHFTELVRQQGQRLVTALIYLNDGFEGGETDFPRLNWRFKGAAGDALIFWNVTASGALEKASLHAGLPPTRGEKWIYSKWVRDRAWPLI